MHPLRNLCEQLSGTGKAVDFKNGKDHPPVYNYKKCIRCFCCQEMCPEKAIKVK